MTLSTTPSASPITGPFPLPATEFAAVGSSADVPEECWRDILELWLSWNETHDQVQARMFKAGENLHELECLLDRADEMRFEAVRRSKALLATKTRRAG
ncbi:MAG: hypothetical protein K2Y37_24660 [Pirellulales bacterium]|nr:hypothetical protein [Pirellulales bacterium]